MWLTLLCPTKCLLRWEGNQMILRNAVWFWSAQVEMNDNTQFLYLFMDFLSNHRRSGDLFVGNAISVTHFAQVCAQRVWRSILVLDHPFGSENWMYVHSAIP